MDMILESQLCAVWVCICLYYYVPEGGSDGLETQDNVSV
jgi:hypothetical protein